MGSTPTVSISRKLLQVKGFRLFYMMKTLFLPYSYINRQPQSRFAYVFRKLHFAVTYYPKASDYDPEPQEGQLIYRDYSAKNGWEIVCQSSKMQIFYSKEEDPVPMETDLLVEVQTIHRAAKKGLLTPYFILLAISVLQGILFVSRLLRDPVGLLSETTNLATGACWGMLFLLCAVEVVGYFSWYRKAARAAETLVRAFSINIFSAMRTGSLRLSLAGRPRRSR